MIFRILLPALILAGFTFSCISSRLQSESAKIGAKQVLDRQAIGWNKGDLTEYMNGYWKSDSLEFVGKSGVTYGWEKTLQNYQKNYPNPAAMGQLTFTILHVNDINPTAAYVTGKWHLTREIGNLEGYFTLLFRKIDNEWKIVADHSS
jgi:ketosteroid isomerase-like protein